MVFNGISANSRSFCRDNSKELFFFCLPHNSFWNCFRRYFDVFAKSSCNIICIVKNGHCMDLWTHPGGQLTRQIWYIPKVQVIDQNEKCANEKLPHGNDWHWLAITEISKNNCKLCTTHPVDETAAWEQWEHIERIALIMTQYVRLICVCFFRKFFPSLSAHPM